MTEYKIATEADFAAIVDFSNDVFSRRQTPQGTAEYDHSFFQNLLPKVYRDPSTAHWHRLAYEDGVCAAALRHFRWNIMSAHMCCAARASARWASPMPIAAVAI